MEAVKPRTREFKLPQWLHPTQIPLTATIKDTALIVPFQCKAPVSTFPSMDECSFIVTENTIKPGDYSCKMSTVTFHSNLLVKALEFNIVAETVRLLNQPPLYII